MKNIIFLDIDGVLNTERWHLNEGQNAPQDQFGDAFDPEAVANLVLIIEKTGADIVISSSWKFSGLESMQAMWRERKLPGKVIGITPSTLSDEMLLRLIRKCWTKCLLRAMTLRNGFPKMANRLETTSLLMMKIVSCQSKGLI